MPRRNIVVSSSSSSSSDDESVSGRTEDIGTITDPKKLHKIIRDVQLQKNTMELEMRRKLGDVTNTASGKKRKKTKTRHASKKRRRAEKDTSETGSNDSSQDEDSQDSDDANGSSSGVEEAADKGALTRVGRLYVLQYGLWVKGGVHIFEQVPDPKYDEKKRFETDTTKIQGQLRDIQKIIPAAYFGKEGRMGGKELVARAFMSGVHSQRSNTSTRIRKAAGPAIFDCGPADLLLPETRLNKFRDQIGCDKSTSMAMNGITDSENSAHSDFAPQPQLLATSEREPPITTLPPELICEIFSYIVSALFCTTEQWLWHSTATVAIAQRSHHSVVQNGAATM
ncbi:hypothetical protein C8J57DRAFT_1734864 [Mycena rebaudengoi]|nr:hypothetical protein C8J57DRAFT_1734864 [Mycena rebaudengoi]